MSHSIINSSVVQLKTQIIKTQIKQTPRNHLVVIQGISPDARGSVLRQGLNFARELELRVVLVDLREFSREHLVSLDDCLYAIAEKVAVQFASIGAPAILVNIWPKRLPSKAKFNQFIRHILSTDEVPLILAIQEIDCLAQADYLNDFLGLLRSWSELGAFPVQDDESCWEKLLQLLTASVDPQQLVAADGSVYANSPFNIGVRINLDEEGLQS